jgi:hypothetical protein
MENNVMYYVVNNSMLTNFTIVFIGHHCLPLSLELLDPIGSTAALNSIDQEPTKFNSNAHNIAKK